MRCITLYQPWASLLAAGEKRCETRHWPIRYRGPLLIHAAKTWNADLAALSRTEPFASVLRSLGVMWSDTNRPALPFGAIVGRVDVVECYPTEKVRANNEMPFVHDPGNWVAVNDQELAFGDYSAGRFAWLCANPVAFARPIPLRGAQGLFDVGDDLVREAT